MKEKLWLFVLILLSISALWLWLSLSPLPLSSGGEPAHDGHHRLDSLNPHPGGGNEETLHEVPLHEVPADAKEAAVAEPGAAPEASPEPNSGQQTYLVWRTHYAVEDFRRYWPGHPAPVTASGAYLEPGMVAAYAVRDRRGVPFAAYIPSVGVLPFGTRLEIRLETGEAELVVLQDTGAGPPDGRPWLDQAVSTRGQALERGAEWVRVRIAD